MNLPVLVLFVIRRRAGIIAAVESPPIPCGFVRSGSVAELEDSLVSSDLLRNIPAPLGGSPIFALGVPTLSSDFVDSIEVAT